MIDRRILVLLALAGCGEAPEHASNPSINEVEASASNVPVRSPVDLATRRSEFTTLDMDRCQTIEESEEGPYWLGSCPGYAGWRIEWSESDLRQSLTLIDKAGRKTDLDLSALVAEGAFNTMNGGKIEWRGDDPAKPDTLIVRMKVDAPEPHAADISKLAVVRLSPTPCVIAVVAPAANQNSRARAVADGRKRDCMTA